MAQAQRPRVVDYPSDQMQIKVGDRVQVVDSEHKDDGSVGTVQAIANDKIQVDLDGHFDRGTFRSDQLKLVGEAAQQPPSQQGLSSGAKIGIAVAAVIVLLVFVVGIVSNARSHSQKPYYQQGYNYMMDAGRDAQRLATSRGTQYSLADWAISPQNVDTTCRTFMSATQEGVAQGRVQLPADFSSGDWLKGCTDAGNDMLKSGQ